jgi:hypothetical protein
MPATFESGASEFKIKIALPDVAALTLLSTASAGADRLLACYRVRCQASTRLHDSLDNSL